MAVTINGSGQIVVQIVQTAYTTVDSTTSLIPTMANTGCTATITPTSSSNRILAMLSMATYHATSPLMSARIMRGSSAAFSGIAGDNYYGGGNGISGNINIQWLDSPATTSAVTYTAQFAVASGTGQLNKDFFNNNNGVTYLTLMEISG